MGLMLELEWGLPVYGTVYLVSGLCSSLLSCMALPDTLGVGSSGALMGLLGAWLVEIVLKWGAMAPEEVPTKAAHLVLVFLNIVITLSFSTVPYVDWAAHMGGLLGGMLVSAVIFAPHLKVTPSPAPPSAAPLFRGLRTQDPRVLVRAGAGLALAAYLATGFAVVAAVLEPSRHLLRVCEYFREAFADPNMPC